MSTITAQISLYPLGEASSTPSISALLDTLRSYDLEIQSGAMSSILSGDDSVVFAALQAAFHQAAAQGRVVMVVTFSNACPKPSAAEEAITYTPIGHIENAFDEPAAPDEIKAADSRIVLNPTLVEGLHGLEAGQHLLVVFHFDRAQERDLLQHPRGDRARQQRGVFALRSPHRRNPVGVTVVELVQLDENVLTVRGLDALNGTPVLDLKRQP
ncbi:MAG: tRNA (N6-threonylcarbamoyladenosine(37)-N6)-methyltransferase TrmO [Anaerolineae bacterium]|nr:tRNA (N6-threonylcarbamoyladenosine(37)-N6)-methyltransferase TrmO [Anaerolineae bacterium]